MTFAVGDNIETISFFSNFGIGTKGKILSFDEERRNLHIDILDQKYFIPQRSMSVFFKKIEYSDIKNPCKEIELPNQKKALILLYSEQVDIGNRRNKKEENQPIIDRLIEQAIDRGISFLKNSLREMPPKEKLHICADSQLGKVTILLDV